MLLGETVAVLTLAWNESAKRLHVLTISASYLVLVVLAMQPALAPAMKLHPVAHTVLATVAYLLGLWSLWKLMPRPVRAADEKVTP
jgi:hypothetical protein